MRQALGLVLIGFLAFVLVADQTPASFMSRLKVLFGGTQYAASVFDDRVPVDRVLASGNGYASRPDQAACWIAVVALAADAPPAPPRVPVIKQDFTRFGGSWRVTPLVGGPPLAVDILKTCGAALDPFTRQSLEKALSGPGAFVIRDWKNGVLQVYAPKRGLAAQLMYK